MVNPVRPAREEAKDHQDPQDLPAMPVHPVNREPPVSREPQAKMALAAPLPPALRALAVAPDLLAHQGPMATRDNQDRRDHQDLQDRTVSQETQEPTDSQDRLEAQDYPDPTPHTAHARPVLQSSCTASRVYERQFPELHRTAILLLSVLVIEKVRKDCLPRRLK
jgi:hypothetical protein